LPLRHYFLLLVAAAIHAIFSLAACLRLAFIFLSFFFSFFFLLIFISRAIFRYAIAAAGLLIRLFLPLAFRALRHYRPDSADTLRAFSLLLLITLICC